MDVVVLGGGCSKCHSTVAMVERVAKELGLPIQVSLNVSKEERERLGIHATPAVTVDGAVVHSGGVPPHDKVQTWLKPKPIELLSHPTRHIFFTGKGGCRKNLDLNRGGIAFGRLRQKGPAREHRLGLQSR
jgi:arsenite-transporting ATPase